jgi:hypothetical protein
LRLWAPFQAWLSRVVRGFLPQASDTRTQTRAGEEEERLFSSCHHWSVACNDFSSFHQKKNQIKFHQGFSFKENEWIGCTELLLHKALIFLAALVFFELLVLLAMLGRWR